MRVWEKTAQLVSPKKLFLETSCVVFPDLTLLSSRQGNLDAYALSLEASFTYGILMVACVKYLGILFCALLASTIQASTTLDGSLPKTYFDADKVLFNKNHDKQIFKGNAIAIAGGALVASDELTLDYQRKIFTATQHVVVLSLPQIFIGDHMEFNLAAGTFSLANARMVVNDAERANQIADQVLGLSAAEVFAEKHRYEQLAIIQSKKRDLQILYAKVDAINLKDKEVIENRYVVLLEEEQLLAAQTEREKSAKTTHESRRKNRREFWNESNSASAVSNSVQEIGYFSVQGERIDKIDVNRFNAENAVVTPCNCAEGESPAWGFRSDSISAQTEGYASLTNPILEIKGIPVLFLPYLKVPVKNERQSGLLFPSFANSTLNGNMMSQPVYIVIDDNQDITTTADLMERRGLRLGLSYQWQQKQYSGWEISFEAMRDRVWLNQQAFRRELATSYQEGLLDAQYKQNPNNTGPRQIKKSTVLNDPGYWNRLQAFRDYKNPQTGQNYADHEINSRLSNPDNSWRGKAEWQGISFVNPRLSLVSKSLVLSDHRYAEDLYLPNITPTLAYEQADAPLFTETTTRIHSDNPNYYLGLGSSFGDSFLTLDHYQGYQLPIFYKVQSRLFNLSPRHFPITIYSQVRLEQKKISTFIEPSFEATLPQDRALRLNGDATWSRAKLEFFSPLIKEQIFQNDLFFQFEGRQVNIDNSQFYDHFSPDPLAEDYPKLDKQNSLHTIRTGIHLGLPLNGIRRTKAKDFDSIRQNYDVIEHQMSNDITFSLRPYVSRQGNYGLEDEMISYNRNQDRWEANPKKPAGYFLTDLPEQKADMIGQEYIMAPHRMIILSTSHDWYFYQSSWNKTTSAKATAKGDDFESLDAQAKRELYYSLDRRMTRSLDFYEGTNWYTNRYTLFESNREQPVHFDSGVSYDYLNELDRAKAKKEGESPLPEPWSKVNSNLTLNYADWKLNALSRYHIYSHQATEMRLSLYPQQVATCSFGLFYDIQKELSVKDGNYSQTLTKTRAISVTSTFIPHVIPTLKYGIKSRDAAQDQRMASVSWIYLAPSNCWGLNFSWLKNFDYPDWSGEYLFTLTVKFLNQQREYGNLAKRLNNPDTDSQK